MTKSVWRPTAGVIKGANITKFMNHHEIKSYEELIHRSTMGTEWFWDACVHETDIAWFEPYIQVLDLSEGIPFAKWFLGGRINIAHNCVDRHLLSKKTAGKTAVIWQGECGAIRKMTYAELGEQTNRTANYLKSIGINKGDRVALYLPMLPELVSVFFAILKIGAVAVPIFKGLDAGSLQERLCDAGVKCVFTADATLDHGEKFSLKARLDAVLEDCPLVEKCIVIKRMGLKVIPMKEGRDAFFEDSLEGQSGDCPTVELASEERCMILYTRGTTGKPKGTVHTHAGALAQVTKELFFHFDLKPKDVFFWATDLNGMMGPWEIIGVTHFNATMVMIEGDAVFPKASRIFKLCQDESVTHLGFSPELARIIMEEGRGGVGKYRLHTLRMIGSAGGPWDAEAYDWCFEHIGGKRLPMITLNSATEVLGSFLAPLVIQEIKPCLLQGLALGMAVAIFNEAGAPVPCGQSGCLVVRRPVPSMTKGLLNDNKRYFDTYFSKYKNVWNQGDWVVQDSDGHWFVAGRVDDTIHVAGKRAGPFEVESCLSAHPFVSESCVIGIPDQQKGEALTCFVVIGKNVGKTDFLLTDLKDRVAKQFGPELRPDRVHVVDSLAKMLDGKVAREIIKRKYLGMDIGDLSGIESPEDIDSIPVCVC